jgi:magnesium-transporting ATPase (P-type)
MKRLKLTTDKYLNLFFLVCGISYLIFCTGLPMGTFSSPGEGMVPVMMGSLMVIFSTACLLRGGKNAKETQEATEKMDRGTIVRTIKVAVTILAYIFFISVVGFKISTFVATVAAVRVFGNTNWKSNLTFSVLTTVFTAVLFQVWLKIPLPEPILQHIFG